MGKHIDLTEKGIGLTDPSAINPGPTSPFSGSPGQPATPGPGDNPGPHIMPPVPGTPRPGDPPPSPTIPAPQPPPSTPTQPPTAPPPRPTMRE
jgi:hypothetical protein